VTTVGTGIDDAVLRLSTTFEKRGLPEKLTSYDADSGGSVVNDVKFVHNDFGQLVTEYQEHEGAVNTSTTPTVAYTYPAGSGGHVRLQKTTYPNGRVLRYEYNTGLDDAMNRVSFLADDDAGSVGTHLAEYSYLGAGMIACEDFCQPQVRLDRDHGVSGEYAGWDRFGRVVDHLWRDYGASADRDRYTYGYDRSGNRLYRENTTASGKDEFYTYDGVDQLTAFDRGDLNPGKTAITGTPVREQDFTLAPTGNWTALVEKTDGTTDLNQSRTHNAANEITQVDAASTHVGHDAAGNMTKTPKPDDWDDHFDLVFDAWNRLVRVVDSGTTVAAYEYDARNFRVLKLTYSSGILDETRDFYYNAAWQCLEEHVEGPSASGSSSGTGSAASAERQFVWGLRYIDAAVLCDRDTMADGTLDERVYYLNDANFNVTCLVDEDGAALERYIYAPYGQATIYNADWSTICSTSSHDNPYLYTGRRLDAESALYYCRARHFNAALGRFLRRDPIGFGGGDANLYRYVHNSPILLVDPMGLAVTLDKVKYIKEPVYQFLSPVWLVVYQFNQDAVGKLLYQKVTSTLEVSDKNGPTERIISIVEDLGIVEANGRMTDTVNIEAPFVEWFRMKLAEKNACKITLTQTGANTIQKSATVTWKSDPKTPVKYGPGMHSGMMTQTATFASPATDWKEVHQGINPYAYPAESITLEGQAYLQFSWRQRTDFIRNESTDPWERAWNLTWQLPQGTQMFPAGQSLDRRHWYEPI
ncbi:MAG: RHS repeat-associated core domain-containing protein, partial [Planctomycetes bacterium]|nr:RHS repeat-associated core domain-containing protein [Planctomycetota bacterium]